MATRTRSTYFLTVPKRILTEIAFEEGGDVEKAATGDPPKALTKLSKRIIKKPLAPSKKPSDWKSKGGS